MSVFSQFQQSAVAVAIASALTLTACGGSGDNARIDPVATNRTVSGTAAKGIIQHGLVTAVELNANGTAARTVGTTTTDTKGKYQLKLNSNYRGGPLRVTVASQPGTTMICDIHSTVCEYGKPFTPGAGFSLNAVLPPVAEDATISAQVTPLTHMAAARAIASGNVTRTSVNNANSEISQLVGVNILAVPPVDITGNTKAASDNELTYAAFVAGAGKLALEDAGGLGDGLVKLATTFQDGQFDDSDDIQITRLLNAVENEATSSKIESTRLSAQIHTITAQLGSDGSYDPKPNTQTGSDVDLAKQLVGQTRLWVSSFSQLEQPLQAFGGDVELAGQAFDPTAAALVEFFTQIMSQVSDYFDGLSSQEIFANSGQHQIPITSATGQPLQDMTVNAADHDGLELTVPATTFSNGVTLSLSIDTTVPVNALDNTAFNLSGLNLQVIARVENSAAKLEINPLTFQSTLNTEISIDPDSETAPEPDIANATLQGSIILTNKNSGISFTGDSLIKVVKLNNAQPEGTPVSVEHAALNGKIAALDGRSLEGKFDIKLSNAASFDTFAFLNHDAEIEVNEFEAGDFFGIAEIAQASGFQGLAGANWSRSDNQLFLLGESSTAFSADPALIEAAEAEIIKQYPGALSARIHDFNYSDKGTYYSAHLSFGDFENAQNFARAEVTAVIDLSLTQLPDSHAVLTAKRTGLESGEATFTLTHDSRSLSATVNNVATNQALGTVIFSNPTGATLTLEGIENQLSGKLSVNGNDVGQIEQTDNGLAVIRYADGTLESLQ